jgi:hypothetical protein
MFERESSATNPQLTTNIIPKVVVEDSELGCWRALPESDLDSRLDLTFAVNELDDYCVNLFLHESRSLI